MLLSTLLSFSEISSANELTSFDSPNFFWSFNLGVCVSGVFTLNDNFFKLLYYLDIFLLDFPSYFKFCLFYNYMLYITYLQCLKLPKFFLDCLLLDLFISSSSESCETLSWSSYLYTKDSSEWLLDLDLIYWLPSFSS